MLLGRPAYSRLPTDAAASTSTSTSTSSSSSLGSSNEPKDTTIYSSSPRPYQRFKRLLIIAIALILVSALALHQQQIFAHDHHHQEPPSLSPPGRGHGHGHGEGSGGGIAASFKKWASSTSNGIAKVFGSSSSSSSMSSTLSTSPDEERRITLVAMWDDDYLATYLPAFFSSAKRNADAIDLLWINVMREGNTCLDVRPYTQNATNIKTLCISDEADKQLIREHLCDAWDCTPEQIEQVDAHLKTRLDPIHCEFKPLRGGIYKRWIKTKWWAWADADQIIGNFRDMWPWHVIDSFDVATISEWDVGNIYLRGQFTAFKHTGVPTRDRLWLKYPPLSSPDALPTLGHGPLDEFDYSVFYSHALKDDNLNWILIPRALGADKFGRNKLVSNGKRNFYVPEDMRRRDVTMLLDERFAPKAEPAFAPVNPFEPEKWAVPVRELRKGDHVNGQPLMAWCDQKETRCTALRESYWHASTVMRYNGQLLEYFDQRSHPRQAKVEIFFGIEEKLLLHHQENKRQDWWDLPPNGIGEDEILEIRAHSIVMWNIHTLETVYTARAPNMGKSTTPENELLAHGYWQVNGSAEMPLPVGIQQITQDLRDA